MTKVLLFDNDGVLAHTEELFYIINQECFVEMGIPYTREDFENHTFITNLGTTGFMKNYGCTDEQIIEFKGRRDPLWQSAILTTNTVDPEAETIFQLLKKDYKIGVVTNTNRENFLKTHHSSNIPNLADFIITREDYDKGKPEPDGYLKGLQIAGCSPDEALVIEDSPRGIVAAKAAGIQTIAIVNPVIKNLDTSNADFQISSILDLPTLLQSYS